MRTAKHAPVVVLRQAPSHLPIAHALVPVPIQPVPISLTEQPKVAKKAPESAPVITSNLPAAPIVPEMASSTLQKVSSTQ